MEDYVYVYGTGDPNRHKPTRIDYSVLFTLGPIMMVLSVSVMLQGLMMTVEGFGRIFRRRLDHVAMGLTFFAVLEAPGVCIQQPAQQLYRPHEAAVIKLSRGRLPVSVRERRCDAQLQNRLVDTSTAAADLQRIIVSTEYPELISDRGFTNDTSNIRKSSYYNYRNRVSTRCM